MVIDTSAIVAIVLREPSASDLLAVIQAADERLMSVVSQVEVATVLTPRGLAPANLDALLTALEVELVPVDEAQGREAIRARIAYGKGTGRTAQLNFGDTFTYALAKTRAAPLLFVGDDFSQTDLIDALA